MSICKLITDEWHVEGVAGRLIKKRGGVLKLRGDQGVFPKQWKLSLAMHRTVMTRDWENIIRWVFSGLVFGRLSCSASWDKYLEFGLNSFVFVPLYSSE